MKLVADKANCTFWWRIHMNVNHPQVKSTIKTIDGYSKFVLNAEAKDKEDVLMAKIEMLYKNGYLDKSTSIDIYAKVGSMPNIQNDRHILTLKSNDYIIIDISPKRWRTIEFLKNFYDCIKNKREVKFIRPLSDKSQNTNPDTIFDISIHNFKTYAELYKFAEKQKSLGRAPGQVDAFVQKYISEKLNNTPTNSHFMQLMEKFNKKH